MGDAALGQPRHRQRASARYFIELARRDAERRELRLPDRDLAYFEEGAQHFDDYVEAVGWAQDYAAAEPARDDGSGARGAAPPPARRSRSPARW